MKKEELFTDEFLKRFKTGDELTGFLKQIQKRGIEMMLEGELDAHLDYSRYQKSKELNARSGRSKSRYALPLRITNYGSQDNRDASFGPMVVPKRGNTLDGIENVIISLYANGMSNADIEERIHCFLDERTCR